jgi:tetratricopeptide (TPR) repeat protein
LLIDRELGRRHGEAITLGNLGNAWLGLGEYDQARRHLEEGLRLTRAVGDRASEPFPLICLSEVALRQGDAATALAHALSALDIAIAVQSPESETSALCTLGDVELALGHHAAAALAYERANAVALTIDDPMQYDAAAGLARVALAQGDVARALVPVEGLLAHLMGGGTLEGTEKPRLIELSCHQVLASAGDPRAAELLARAYAEIEVRAAAIADPTLRHSFLNEVPEHREIVAAFRAFAPSTMKPR